MAILHYLPMFFATNLFMRRMCPDVSTTNITSAIHATTTCIGTVLSMLRYIPFESVHQFSSAYFMYDATMLLMKRPFGLTDAGFLYHHAASIVLMSRRNNPTYFVRYIFLLSELSNLPMYVVKYLIDNGIQGKRLRRWKLIQFATYFPLRILGVGYFSARAISTHYDDPAIWFLSPMLLLILEWVRRLWHNLPIG